MSDRKGGTLIALKLLEEEIRLSRVSTEVYCEGVKCEKSVFQRDYFSNKKNKK